MNFECYLNDNICFKSPWKQYANLGSEQYPSFNFRSDDFSSERNTDETSGKIDASDTERQGVNVRHLRQDLRGRSEHATHDIFLFQPFC